MKKIRNSNNLCAIAMGLMAVLLFVGNSSAQILRVDSVAVDSVWNSDSSWLDSGNRPVTRISRDCWIDFIVRGEGYAKMSVTVSYDSGKTWENSAAVLYDMLSRPYLAEIKSFVKVRVLGGDRPGVMFKMTARQAAPVIAGDPKTKVLGFLTALSPGTNSSVPLAIKLLGNSKSSDGYCSISKVYWDALGDGSINDSTAGTNVLSWNWFTQVPVGTPGQSRTVIAKAFDKNGLSSAPETLEVRFGLKRPIVMKNIPAGTFMMGDTSIIYLKPVHQVTLSAFKLQETEVTQEQYFAVMGTNPSFFSGDLTRPVEMVHFVNAAIFCNKLSILSGLTAVYDTFGVVDTSKSGYRLPSEAQWEYACRAGTTSMFWWGNDTVGMGARAWSQYNSGNTTQPVATTLANAYGLYDMLGNVWEWCGDTWDKYPNGPQTDPLILNGSYQVFRGGDWSQDSTVLFSADRNYTGSYSAYKGCGFRIALPVR